MTLGSSTEKPPLLTPGIVIELADMTELAALEDIVVKQVDPNYDKDLWIARPLLKELLRPTVKKRAFNGGVKDITLTVMDEPYEQLITANDRGLTYSQSGKRTRTNDQSLETIERYVGLEYRATLTSTGHGSIGSVTSEIWYAPLAKSVLRRKGSTYCYPRIIEGEQRPYECTQKEGYVRANKLGDAILRVTSKPAYDQSVLVSLQDSAQRIGFNVLQAAMRRPISAPMQK